MSLTAIRRTECFEPPLIDLRALDADPHAAFRRLRPAHPVVRLDERQFMLLRAVDVVAVMTDPRTRQVEGADYVDIRAVPAGAAARFLSDVFLFANGRDHRIRRGLFSRAFSMGRISGQQGKIRAVADTIAADLPRGEPFDFVEHMAARLPAEMIARLFGLPVEDAPAFSAHVLSLARALAPVYPHERHAEIESATGALHDYVKAQLADRLANPGDDLLSALVGTWRENPAICFESLVHQVMGMILGGVDTTRAGFAMLVALLLQHPDQWRAVKRDRSLVPGAVAEGLRFEPPVGSILRMTSEPVWLCGYLLPAGRVLRASTMSAMRDPELYAHPDCFDIHRTDHPRLHAVYGHGAHRCIGEMLARLEMESALSALIDRAPEIELLSPPRMIGCAGLRRITPMTVRIG